MNSKEGKDMGLIVWIVFGALAGWLASVIMGTDDRQGCITNIIVGVIGAFVGGLVVSLFGGVGVTGFDLRSFLVAVLGAVIFLALAQMVTGRRR
jgi:uncharacterized membrane protein YeaQ/YmgE (transglycosylase-associated protein family)